MTVRSRLHPMHRDRRGFTLIELIVVVIIIGVLAAVAIPQLIDRVEDGRDAAAQSELRNAATAMELSRAARDTYVDEVSGQPGTTDDLADFGFNPSGDVTLTVLTPATGTGADTFCLSAVHAVGNTVWYLTNVGGEPTTTDCSDGSGGGGGGDTTPPSVPTGLASVGTFSQVASMTWDSHPDGDGDLTSLKLFRDGALVATLGPTATSYVDTGLTNGTTYTYHLTAVDTSGNESAASATLDVTPAGSYAALVADDGAAHHWRLGEAPATADAVDAVGSVDGTYAFSPTLGAAGAIAGDADTAATFATSPQGYLWVPAAAAVAADGSDFTIESWIKHPGALASGDVSAIYGEGDSSGRTAMLYLYNDGDGNAKLRFFNHDGTTSVIFSPSPPVDLADNAWHHVAVTYTAGTYRLYTDGAEVASTAGGPLTFTPVQIRIGHDGRSDSGQPVPGYEFDGSLDEVATYDLALSAAQIAAHHDAGANGNYAPDTPDAVAPAAPTGLVSDTGSTDVVLTWDPNAESDLSDYLVYRDGTLVDTVAAPTTTATLSGLSAGSAYSFTVAARDTWGNVSPVSAAFTATTWEVTGFQQAVLDTTPVAFWSATPGDVAAGQTRDRTGNGYAATIEPDVVEVAAGTTFPAGVGLHLSDDGVGDILGEYAMFPTTQREFTLAYWVGAADASAVWSHVVSSRNDWDAFHNHQVPGTGPSDRRLYTGISSSSRINDNGCAVDDGEAVFVVIAVDTDGGGPLDWELSYVRNGYFSGGTSGNPCAYMNVADPTEGWGGFHVNALNGHIADIAIWDRQLSEQEIVDLYAARTS